MDPRYRAVINAVLRKICYGYSSLHQNVSKCRRAPLWTELLRARSYTSSYGPRPSPKSRRTSAYQAWDWLSSVGANEYPYRRAATGQGSERANHRLDRRFLLN